MKKKSGIALVLPLALWLLVFLVVPYFFILIQSFLQTDSFGRVIYHFNFDSYIKIFSQPLYYGTLLRTLGFAVIVAVVCILFSLPMAYFIAFKVKKNKTMRTPGKLFWVNRESSTRSSSTSILLTSRFIFCSTVISP